jgi:hypothetical protein
MKIVLNLLIAGAILCGPAPAYAQVPAPGRIALTMEGLNVWQQRNDVRIPPDTGTEFSIVDLIGSAPTPSVRVEVAFKINERQDVRFVVAPLRVTGRGTPAAPISFAGEDFAVAPTDAEFKFSSYRATWRYRVYQGTTWTWRVGVTGFVRDARIALSQADRAAEDTDVGFVPLGYVSAEAKLTDRWSLGFDLDGSAAPQGRAFDFSAAVNYRPSPAWTIAAGYRTIEGGADVDAVYTFAWFNAAFVRLGIRF